MPDSTLLQALREIAPPGAGCGWADPTADHGLMEGEALPGAIPARLREFSAGRAAARAALTELGLPPVVIPHGPDRAPVWPKGVIGSITHTATECLAVVLPADALKGIGIDLERQSGLGRDLWPAVLTPLEQGNIGRIPECRQADLALVHFVAKEAAYKAIYPATRTILEFHDLTLGLASGAFRAELGRDVPPIAKGSVITGKIRVANGHILALATY